MMSVTLVSQLIESSQEGTGERAGCERYGVQPGCHRLDSFDVSMHTNSPGDERRAVRDRR